MFLIVGIPFVANSGSLSINPSGSYQSQPMDAISEGHLGSIIRKGLLVTIWVYWDERKSATQTNYKVTCQCNTHKRHYTVWQQRSVGCCWLFLIWYLFHFYHCYILWKTILEWIARLNWTKVWSGFIVNISCFPLLEGMQECKKL